MDSEDREREKERSEGKDELQPNREKECEN